MNYCIIELMNYWIIELLNYWIIGVGLPPRVRTPPRQKRIIELLNYWIIGVGPPPGVQTPPRPKSELLNYWGLPGLPGSRPPRIQGRDPPDAKKRKNRIIELSGGGRIIELLNYSGWPAPQGQDPPNPGSRPPRCGKSEKTNYWIIGVGPGSQGQDRIGRVLTLGRAQFQ